VVAGAFISADRGMIADCEGSNQITGILMKRYKIAVLDDYQNAAMESADWSVLGRRADIAVFQDHLTDPAAVIERLLPFDVICVMRERSPLPRNIIERLPNLKLIASTGAGNTSIDLAAAADHGIAIVHSGYRSEPAIEFTWALILASTRHIVTESTSVRFGGWQQTVGSDLRGKTLGVLGLGRIGSEVARIGRAFGMNLIAWSQNMTPQTAGDAGAILVSKNELFEQADILTIHVVLSSRTRGLVGAAELSRMKPTARLINTSRGPIVDEQALISVLENKQIAGAAIDVFDVEPLPPDHPFRTLDTVLATPHIGYVSEGLYKTFYQDTVSFRCGSTPVRERHAQGGDGKIVQRIHENTDCWRGRTRWNHRSSSPGSRWCCLTCNTEREGSGRDQSLGPSRHRRRG